MSSFPRVQPSERSQDQSFVWMRDEEENGEDLRELSWGLEKDQKDMWETLLTIIKWHHA